MKIDLVVSFISYFISLYTVEAGFTDYITNVGSYFGFHNHNENKDESGEFYNQKIPYEVSTTDEKFLNEAAKFTGVALTELDSCQQRVSYNIFIKCYVNKQEMLL